MTHNLELFRIGNKPSSTLGVLYWMKDKAREYECLILEDEYREVKVAGATRIPAGKYEIKLREVPSDMTTKYRQKYDWFSWHLWLQNVPNFNFVYIHVGNFANEGTGDDDTLGCLLCGTDPGTKDGEFAVWNSADAFKKLYMKLAPALKRRERVFIKIVDL